MAALVVVALALARRALLHIQPRHKCIALSPAPRTRTRTRRRCRCRCAPLLRVPLSPLLRASPGLDVAVFGFFGLVLVCRPALLLAILALFS